MAPTKPYNLSKFFDVIYEKREALNKRYGINIPKTWDYHDFVGQGSKGNAYDVGNKILKLTTDIKEAKASAHIIGKNLKYVNEIYAVFMIKNMDGFYGIIQKKLMFPEAVIGGALYDMENIGLLQEIAHWSLDRPYDGDDNINNVIDSIKEGVDDNGKEVGRPYHSDSLRCVVEFILKSKEELFSNGIRFYDYTYDNTMADGDNLKVIDLGYSTVIGGTGKIDIVESWIKKMSIYNKMG